MIKRVNAAKSWLYRKIKNTLIQTQNKKIQVISELNKCTHESQMLLDWCFMWGGLKTLYISESLSASMILHMLPLQIQLEETCTSDEFT